MLLQKNIQLCLSSTKRVRSLVAITANCIAIANTDTIFLWDIHHNQQCGSIHIQDWPFLKQQDQDSSKCIIEMHYHPFLSHLFILLFESSPKHRNWVLCKIAVTNNICLGEPIRIFQTLERPSKYDQMQLKPKIIILPSSSNYALVRQFYNDSEAIIFAYNANTQCFYLNEESLSSFDDKHELVSYRTQFKNKISVETFDILKEVKTGRNGNVARTLIEYEGIGVVNCVKRISNSCEMLIVLNEKMNQMTYLTCQIESGDILKKVRADHQKIFYLFSMQDDLIISLKQIGKQAQLVLETTTMRSKHEILQKLQFEEWQANKTKGETMVVNYSQKTDNESVVVGKIYRASEKSLLQLALMEKIMGDGILIEESWKQLNL